MIRRFVSNWTEHSIDQLREWNETLNGCNELEEVVRAILGCFSDIEEGISVIVSHDYIVYDNCSSLAEVARTIFENDGTAPNTSLDYEAIGRDMKRTGRFVKAGNKTFVEIY